ncbi:MAG TPA: polysaccharide pyruvyl transferase family protein [Thermoguttaceae bacterium]|nr:polysaccharide pyruvyl transferase family protein [Thermoguttaceae bacterium]
MKILLTCSPHPQLRNLGDHAQAICIHRWLEKHWPGVPVREFTKLAPIDEVQAAARPGDLIFIQSGGNMANRATLSEGVRCEVIRAFPGHKIVQLPQTVSFTGDVLARAKRIYNAHGDLTILARDPRSFELAGEYFPQCKVGMFPDFVLGYPYEPPAAGRARSGALLCLRDDDESILTDRQKRALRDAAAEVAGEVTALDTVLPDDVRDRRREVRSMLDRFAACRVVVTDRLHGTIFAIVTGTPCVVLRTVDHKLDASRHWFGDLPHVVFAQRRTLSEALTEALNATPTNSIDFNARWLDQIPEFLHL